MSIGIDIDEVEDDAPGLAPMVRYPAAPHPPTLGRVLPHLLEAEEFLLSAILLDGEEALAKCEEFHVTAQSFYDARHARIFAQLETMCAEGKPIGVDTLVQELQVARRLESVGGVAFLTQVSSRVPTSAQTQYFIEKVREQEVLRAIIRSATGAVEDAYAYSGDMPAFVEQVRTQIDLAVEGATGAAALLRELEFNPAETVGEAPVVFSLMGVPICRAGNLVTVSAQAKAGKSALIGAKLAAAMRQDPARDCLTVEAHNVDGRPLLHFDTEQCREDWHTGMQRAMRRAGVDGKPDWLKSYFLKGRSRDEKLMALNAACAAHGKHRGLLAVILDGVADFVADVNDPEECMPFITHLEKLAVKYACSIICIIHLNPGTEKRRGHLGSELERKAETNLILEKDDNGITTIYAPLNRKKAISKQDGPRFEFSEIAGMHVTVGDWQARAVEARENKRKAKEAKNPSGFREQFSREEQVSFYPASTGKEDARQVIFRRAQEATAISTPQCDRLRREFLEKGWIVAVGTGSYRRTADGDLWAQRAPRPTPKPELPLASGDGEVAL